MMDSQAKVNLLYDLIGRMSVLERDQQRTRLRPASRVSFEDSLKLKAFNQIVADLEKEVDFIPGNSIEAVHS